MKSVMKLRQNPVRRQYIRSLNAAPMPVKRAGSRPLLSVRCMTSIPIGPIGADIRTPMAMPRGNMCKICSICAKSDKIKHIGHKMQYPGKKIHMEIRIILNFVAGVSLLFRNFCFRNVIYSKSCVTP